MGLAWFALALRCRRCDHYTRSCRHRPSRSNAVKLPDLFRRLGERFLWRSQATGSSGAAPQPRDQAPSLPADEVPWADEEVQRMNPLYVRSREAFYRNLADLMKKHEEEWVAYHGDEYVVAAKT